MSVALAGVQRRFGNGRGVGPVDLRIDDGERVAFMGPNGAGKTTLLRIIATAEHAGAGRVTWDGSTGARDARRSLGYAPDTVVEEATLTARQSTHFWCSQWAPHDDVPALVSRALTAVGLGPVADEPVATFSFGMRRRLGLAQALAHGPRLALLDEPTSGLDPSGVDAVRELVAERARQGWITVVAGNDGGFAASACDRVVFLDAGRILCHAPPAELLAQLSGTRVARLRLEGAADIAALHRVAGAGTVTTVEGGVDVELLDDSALPALVSAADAPGGRLLGLSLHTPDLSDCFRRLAGRPLEPAREDRP